jgi:reversibly glycosylated polypeptide/UDP-arabinopyranose mutase
MIAAVIPTIRPEQYEIFLKAWQPLFDKHQVKVYKVEDGHQPRVNGRSVQDVMGEYSDLIYNFNDGVRNLGFALAYKDGADYIISLDDDVLPYGDTVGDHLQILNSKFPINWMNTSNEVYMRGFPYGIRQEAECVLSHGVWEGVGDFDASTQLLFGAPKLSFPKMAVPKGVLFPVCAMNMAFKRKLVPYIYQAPMFGDLNRFADIWGGIEAKKSIDENNWAAATGFAVVHHNRASDPFKNLVKEARGVGLNEKYGEDEYFKLFQEKRRRWREFLEGPVPSDRV